jgi:hypothetical protein
MATDLVSEIVEVVSRQGRRCRRRRARHLETVSSNPIGQRATG